MKLAVIGGGGVRSPFLAKSLVKNAQEIGIKEIVFMDNNQGKLDIFGKISQKVAEKINADIKFSITTDGIEAVKDAELVITTIRSGGDESRVFDERTALDQGVLGQETTGAGGFAMALRSIPILTDLCQKIVKYSKKNVLLFNFTNPSGLVTQALRDEGFDFVYGICDAPSGFEKQLIKLLGTNEDSFEMTCFGLNHLSWFRDFKVNGEDVYEKIMSIPNIYRDTELRYFGEDIIRLVGQRELPNEYLYFYYYRDQAVESIINSKKTRGETILEINEDMIKTLKTINIDKDIDKAFDVFISHYYQRENLYFSIESGTTRKAAQTIPSLQDFVDEPDDGGYAGVALRFIKAYTTGKPVKMVLSVPNNGAIDFLEDNDVVEISCNIDKGKVIPVRIKDIDPLQKNLIQTIKYFERNTVQAIKMRDKDLAVKALMFHPQINSYPIAAQLLELYLQEYEGYIGEWK